MYCKKAGSDHVMLWTHVKAKNPEYIRCNADGSPLVAEAVEEPAAEVAVADTPKKRKKRETAIQDHVSGEDISFE